MTDLIARLVEPFLRFLSLPPGRRRASPRFSGPRPCLRVCPYSCEYIGGQTAYRRGERPPRGEDSPLVRPYLLAHERQSAPRRRLSFAEPGADLRPLLSWHVGAGV